MTTITIPPAFADAFRSEAVFTLEQAGGQLEEGAKWIREGKGGPVSDGEADRIVEDMARARQAIALFEAVCAGERDFEPDKAVCETIDGMVLEAAGDVHGECENVGRPGAPDAIAKLTVLLDLAASAENGGS